MTRHSTMRFGMSPAPWRRRKAGTLVAIPEAAAQSRGERWSIRLLQVVCLFWLAELIAPLSLLLQSRRGGGAVATTLVAMAVFVGGYAWLLLDNQLTRPAVWETRSARRLWRWAPLGLLAVPGIALSIGLGADWLVLFVFVAVGAAFRLPPPQLGWLIGSLVVLDAVIGLAEQQTLVGVAQFALLISGSGGGVAVAGSSICTSRQLRAARQEIAHLAVEAERLRFARDLHDLLGHDLAHIALKSEVGEAFVLAAPERAAAALREIGDAARTALREVRAAVAGYRRPSLAGELRAAAEILAAAGIAYRDEGAAPVLAPDSEAVLAWAVREGVTNVVKHSRARHCTIRLGAEPGRASVEVVDDGHGVVPAEAEGAPAATGGSGLPGLLERARSVGGGCRTGRLPGGGFQLTVTVPVVPGSAKGATDGTAAAAPVGTDGSRRG